MHAVRRSIHFSSRVQGLLCSTLLGKPWTRLLRCSEPRLHAPLRKDCTEFPFFTTQAGGCAYKTHNQMERGHFAPLRSAHRGTAPGSRAPAPQPA